MAQTPPASLLRVCPICRKPALTMHLQPFCSSRCAQVDLNRWLGGHYAIPTHETAHAQLDGEDPQD